VTVTTITLIKTLWISFLTLCLFSILRSLYVSTNTIHRTTTVTVEDILLSAATTTDLKKNPPPFSKNDSSYTVITTIPIVNISKSLTPSPFINESVTPEISITLPDESITPLLAEKMLNESTVTSRDIPVLSSTTDIVVFLPRRNNTTMTYPEMGICILDRWCSPSKDVL